MKLCRTWLAILFAGLLVGLSVACGGGGGGNSNPTPTPTPANYTITLTPCAGVTFNQSSPITVKDGDSSTITGNFDTANYQNLNVTGMNGTLNASGSTFTYQVPAVHANGIVTATDSPKTHVFTATFVNCTGASFNTSSVPVDQGGTASAAVTIQSGYGSLSVSASDNATPVAISDIAGFPNVKNVVVGPMTGNCTFTANVTPVTPSTVTATFVAGAGTTFSTSSAQLQQGGSGIVSLTLSAGYSNPKVVASDNATPVAVTATSDPAVWSVAFGPVNANCTFTSSATSAYVVVPKVAGKIVYVIDPVVYNDSATKTLLTQWMNAVAADTGCTNVLLTSFSDPKSIRDFLIAQGSGLKLAFLIGNVPIVKREFDGDGDSTLTFHASDQYYRSLKWPFATPTLAADGAYHIPDTFLASTCFYEKPDFMPTIAISRIMGNSAATQLTELQAFFTKDIALRNDLGHYPSGVHQDEANAWQLLGVTFPEADTEAAYLNHPLVLPGSYTLTSNKTSAVEEQDFLDALHTNKYVKLTAHAQAKELAFCGSDAPTGSVTVVDSATIIPNDVKARFVNYTACFSGDFSVWGNTGMRTVLAGDALLVKAPSLGFNTSQYQSIIDSLGYEYALGVGRTYGFMYAYVTKGEVESLIGDPTVTMQTVDSTKPQPRMVIDGKLYAEEFALPVTLPNPSYGYDVVVTNVGTADLVVNCDIFPAFPTAAKASGMPHWMVSMNGTSAVGCNIYTVRIPAGSSQTMRFLLMPTVNGETISGSQQATFFLTCNDPNIGAFRVDTTAAVQ